jgi:hypothetical protein
MNAVETMKPTILPLNTAGVPPELRAIPAWVGWRITRRGGRPTKEPVDLKTGGLGETDNPKTWTDFGTAVACYERLGCAGIGLCRTEDFIFIDLDGVFAADGSLHPYKWAHEILSAMQDRAYVERSVSGLGIHIICRGVVPPGRRQYDEPGKDHVGYGFYDRNRYLTFSGDALPGCGPIQDLTPEMAKLHPRLFPARPSAGNGHQQRSTPLDVSDTELIEKARRANAAFARLFDGDWSGGKYGSQSEADMALCCHLAFWTGGDAVRMDSLFRQSGLYRLDKWERSDYRDGTIKKAIEQTRERYDPRRPSDGPSTESHSIGGARDEWPTLRPIPGSLSPVEPFCGDLLPEALRPLVTDVTERLQVPMDYPAVAILLSLAGAVSRRAVIQPKEHDSGWVVVPNLWGGIVAPPGYMKSAVIQAATRPLNQIQTEWRREYDEAQVAYDRGKEEHELRRAAWKEQFKAASKGGRPAPGRPEGEPKMPTLRRIVINDATVEKLHETMSEKPGGHPGDSG